MAGTDRGSVLKARCTSQYMNKQTKLFALMELAAGRTLVAARLPPGFDLACIGRVVDRLHPFGDLTVQLLLDSQVDE